MMFANAPVAAQWRKVLAAMFLVAGVAAGAPIATAQTANGGDAADLFAGGWRKVSVPNPADQTKPVTLVTQEARDKNNVPIAEVTIMMEADKKKRMLVIVPQGFLLPAGIRLQVDKNEPVAGTYIYCREVTCQAEAEITDDFISQMKKGANLIVAVATLPDGKARAVGISLTGFTAAFDGEALDIAKYKEQRRAFNEMLQKRAEENKQRLQQQREQQGGAQPQATQQ
ncbi:MAG: invasion associated locus B family protein [Rhodobiaceae bacterium]|nr:invasion associated locus B family protein [Rhodobiaceae bacterium]MCC0052941.1 invasion associated locus B family protein [Rhodobiaceae bacterium]